MTGKHITHCSTHQHAVICSGASCISFHFTCCVVMFHRKCCTVIQQVLERSHWSNSARACAHTHAVNVVILWSQTTVERFPLPLLAHTHWYTHTQFQVRSCCCSLDVLHSQCAQIILANNFLLPVSDSATSCLLSRVVHRNQSDLSQSPYRNVERPFSLHIR